jgi:phosphoglycolate phosphatase
MAPEEPHRVGAVVFDLDGTLVDSRRDIADATNHTLIRSGRAALSEAEITSYVGDGARALLSRAARVAEGSAELDALLREFLDFYTAHATDFTLPLAHAEAVLEELGRSWPLALCTNKPRRTTNAVIEKLGLARHFAAVIAGDDLSTKKPDPGPLLAIAERLGVSPRSLVMVGDGPQDVLAGQRAGARTVGLEGGLQDRARLLAASPDAMLGSLAELPGLLRRWDGAHATSR